MQIRIRGQIRILDLDSYSNLFFWIRIRIRIQKFRIRTILAHTAVGELTRPDFLLFLTLNPGPLGPLPGQGPTDQGIADEHEPAVLPQQLPQVLHPSGQQEA